MFGYNNPRGRIASNPGQHSNAPFHRDHFQPRQQFYEPVPTTSSMVPGQGFQSRPGRGIISGYNRPPQRDRPQNLQRNRQFSNQRQERSNSANNSIDEDCKKYVCPSCSRNFDYQGRTTHAGRTPLVLKCEHTICQECISDAIHLNTVICPTCQKPSELPANRQHRDKFQEIFTPNFYILGRIMWSRSQMIDKAKHIALVPTQKTLNNKTLSEPDPEPSESEGEPCCFVSCTKKAVLRCRDCKDVYCTECCTAVHKSELEKCLEHGMDIELYCNTCEVNVCCYCFLEKHEGHEKEYLFRLTDEEQNELDTYKKKAKLIIKRLIASQKKLKDLSANDSSSIEKQIMNFFANFHARLYFAEKKILLELNNVRGGSQPVENFSKINSQLTNSIKMWKTIVGAVDTAADKKMNLRAMLEQLRDVDSTPCFLLTESDGSTSEFTEFSVDPVLDNLSGLFSIKKSDSDKLQLLNFNELPPDYVMEPLETKEESSSPGSSGLASSKKEKSNRYNKRLCSQSQHGHRSSGRSEMYRPTLNRKFMLDNEKVDVTHIESLECFYVQLKTQQLPFMHMAHDIENYIKLGADLVESPQINELYLALYVTKDEKMWCRVRLTEIKEQEDGTLYEVYFIDLGSTQLMEKSKLREITAVLAQKKPFAIQCELYNPTRANWNKNAHVYMGKIINGKELYMVQKGVNNGIHLVDLMISSSDGNLTSIIDILIHTCTNVLSSSNESLNSVHRKIPFNPQLMIFSNSTKFTKHQTEKVLLANVVDPHHIFVQLVKYNDLFKTLMSDMKRYYKRRTCQSFLPIEGCYVAVEHRDPVRGNWHRAFLKKVDVVAEKASVLLVDWGVNVIIPLFNIKMLTEDFIRLETQAILVKLAHIEPYQGGYWSDSSTFFLQKNFRSQKALQMIVHNLDPLEVALFENTSCVNYCINAQLVRENFADSTGKISQTLEWPEACQEELQNIEEEEGFVAGLLKKMDESPDEESQEEHEEAVKYVKQQITVMKIVSPEMLFIKFKDLEVQEMEMHRELQVHYNKAKLTKEAWRDEEACVVRLPDFYARARIECKVEDKYKVHLLDLGDEAVLPIDKIFMYQDYFKKFPKFLYQCHLADIKPAGGDKWSMSSIEALEGTFANHKSVYTTKVSRDTATRSMPMIMWYTRVKLGGALEPNITRFISINNLLVKLGFAYKVKNPVEEESAHAVDTDSESAAGTEVTVTAMVHRENLNSLESTVSGESEVVSILGGNGRRFSKSTRADWNDLIEEEQKQNADPNPPREVDISEWMPAFRIKKREFNAWVTCADPDGVLYLRDEELQPVYKKMEVNLKEYFDRRPFVDELHDWEVDQMCTIAYKDNFYRGKILKVNSPTEFSALMIDFGSDHIVSPKQLHREILYPEIPAFASKVKLDRVFSVVSESEEWPSADYDTFLEVVPEYSRIVIKGPLEVDVPLAEVYDNKGQSINELLVKLCPNLTRGESEGSDGDLALVEEESSLKSSNQSGSTSTLEFKVEELPPEGFEGRVAMEIVGVLSYNKVVLKKTEEDYASVTALNADIEKSHSTQPDLETIEVGVPCICPYTEDGMWYRALVHNIEGIDCGYVFVFFVDFGNVESVSVREMKMMKPDWFELPISCYIAELNVELKTNNHVEHVLQHMKKLYLKKKLAHFVSEDPLVVDLFESDGELCYQSLISNGLLQVKC